MRRTSTDPYAARSEQHNPYAPLRNFTYNDGSPATAIYCTATGCRWQCKEENAGDGTTLVDAWTLHALEVWRGRQGTDPHLFDGEQAER